MLSVRGAGGASLSAEGVTCTASEDTAGLLWFELLHAKWEKPLSVSVPIRHVCRGEQDLTLRAPPLGDVTICVNTRIPNLSQRNDAAERAAAPTGKAAEIDALFKKCDKNHDGRVSKRELKTALKANALLFAELGLRRIKDVHAFMDRCDADSDGSCDLEEWRGFFKVLEASAGREGDAHDAANAAKAAKEEAAAREAHERARKEKEAAERAEAARVAEAEAAKAARAREAAEAVAAAEEEARAAAERARREAEEEVEREAKLAYERQREAEAAEAAEAAKRAAEAEAAEAAKRAAEAAAPTGKAAEVDALFAKCDKNHDGRVSKRELKTALKANALLFAELGLRRIKDVHAFMDRCDADSDGSCDLEEWRGFFKVLEASAGRAAEAEAEAAKREAEEEAAVEAKRAALEAAEAAKRAEAEAARRRRAEEERARDEPEDLGVLDASPPKLTVQGPSDESEPGAAGVDARGEGGEEEEGEEEEGEEEEDLAELEGDAQLGSTLSVSIPPSVLPASGGRLAFVWHRSVDKESWEAIDGAESERYVLGAEDVSCWLFAEWRYVTDDAAGAVIKEGSTEASEQPVRLLPEDRDDLKDVVLAGEASYDVTTRDGPAKLTVSKGSVALKSRFGGTKVVELTSEVLRSVPGEPTSLTFTPPPPAKPTACSFDSSQQRDLAILSAHAFVHLAADASFEGACKVWEGDEYGDYYGLVHGHVMLLFEGADAPSDGVEPTEALLLHGCRAENVDDESADDGLEISISDAGGEVFSLCVADDAARDEWREAIETRSAPPAIARASHILLKHNESRRLASWRDPEGREIRRRSKESARAQLVKCRRMIEGGESELDDLAREISDCDTSKHGGDLGWFAANYMQPEFEKATLDLEVGQLSDVIETASGLHLIQRTG